MTDQDISLQHTWVCVDKALPIVCVKLGFDRLSQKESPAHLSGPTNSMMVPPWLGTPPVRTHHPWSPEWPFTASPCAALIHCYWQGGCHGN